MDDDYYWSESREEDSQLATERNNADEDFAAQQDRLDRLRRDDPCKPIGALTERDSGEDRIGRNAATSGRREQPTIAFPAELSDSSRSVSAPGEKAA